MNEPRLNLIELTVSELSASLKRTIEDAFDRVRVRGELGNVKYHSSGHVYLDLKDDKACLAGMIWRTTASRIKLKLEAGLEVVVTGRVTTYPGQSKYQIVIDTLEPAGLGALMALVEERKSKLAAEGLFDATRKQLLPFLPAVIGVITSPTGAVIRDILHRLRDRFPRRVLVWPVKVQGEGSAEQVAAAIHGFNALAPKRTHSAARSPDRRARRRLARRPLVVQRGDRRARRGREHDPADLRRRPRDRRDADRFRLRPARADADRRRRNGGAGARRTAWRGSTAWRGARLLLAARQEARRTELRAAARALPDADELLALPRQRLDHATARLPRALTANTQIDRVEVLAARRARRAAATERAGGTAARAPRQPAGAAGDGAEDLSRYAPGRASRAIATGSTHSASAPCARSRTCSTTATCARSGRDNCSPRSPIAACWSAALPWCAISTAVRCGGRRGPVRPGPRHRIRRWPGARRRGRRARLGAHARAATTTPAPPRRSRRRPRKPVLKLFWRKPPKPMLTACAPFDYGFTSETGDIRRRK